MRSILFLFSGLVLLMVGACQIGNESEKVNSTSQDTTLVLTGLSQTLSLVVPKTMPGLADAELGYNDNFGQLEVLLGDGFHLQISEEDIPVRTFKEELENDMLFSHTFEVENDSELVYRSFLPDGKPHSYQFVKSKSMGEMKLMVKTAPMGEFNKQQMERMSNAVNTIRIAE